MVSMGALTTFPLLSTEYVDHLPPIITRMYQNSWTPETPRVWSGRSGIVILLFEVTVKAGCEIVTGGGPSTPFPDSKNPTCVTLVNPDPLMTNGSVTVPLVSTG